MFQKTNYRKYRKLPVEIEKGAQRFKEQLERHRNFQKSNTYRSEPRNLFKANVYKASASFKLIEKDQEESHPREFRKSKYSLMPKEIKSDKKRKNRKELNSFQDNIDDLDNLSKLANERDRIVNEEPIKVSSNNLVTRHSNPNTFSSNSRLSELKNITESPEYNNIKYSDSKKNTISQKYQNEEEVDEHSIYESPSNNPSKKKLKRRGLVINASGTKKPMNTFNKRGSNFGATIRKYNADSKSKGLRKKQHTTNSMNLNHRIINGINYNKTQRVYTDSLGISPKKGVNLVPI